MKASKKRAERYSREQSAGRQGFAMVTPGSRFKQEFHAGENERFAPTIIDGMVGKESDGWKVIGAELVNDKLMVVEFEKM